MWAALTKHPRSPWCRVQARLSVQSFEYRSKSDENKLVKCVKLEMMDLIKKKSCRSTSRWDRLTFASLRWFLCALRDGHPAWKSPALAALALEYGV